MPVRWIPPMLPVRSQGMPIDAATVAFELKWDGCRALVHVAADGAVTVRNRQGRDRSSQWPELGGLGEALGRREAYLDGEIVAFGADGLPDFNRPARRFGSTSRATRRAVPVCLSVFDVLRLDGEPTTPRPYRERRRLLESLELRGPAWCTITSHVGLDAGAQLWEASRKARLEGVVAKLLDAPYTPGARSPAWPKLKHPHARDLHRGAW